MRIFRFLFVLFLMCNSNFAIADDNKMQNKIAKNLRCLICQGQSVYDSDSEFAISVKLVIQNKLSEGLTEEQIYELLIKKYGDWISYNPKFRGNTYFLWLLPLLIFLFGGAIIFRKVIRIEK
tara:strand:+ start:385 stop:750 length:366 start_codon:yes stop_codon:yes gene_type:complete